MVPIIELRNVKKSFFDSRNGPVSVLEDLSFVIERKQAPKDELSGEFIVILGPSGCGKSTVLSLIAGLVLPDKGEIFVFGEGVTAPHTYSATVPQAYTCFPWLTVVQNVEFGLRLKGGSDETIRRVAREYLDKVGLGDRAQAFHRELSGGMQQRVAIARTLAMQRPIVLMDEPFGALDAQTREDMQQMLLKLWIAEQNTIVFVTHDISEALLLADRIIVFSQRPGRIVQDILVPFSLERSPEVIHSKEFSEYSKELRQLLRKPRNGAESKGDS